MDINLIAQIFAYAGLYNLTKFSQISVKYCQLSFLSKYQYIISLSAKDVNELLILVSGNSISRKLDHLEIVRYCLQNSKCDLLYSDCRAFNTSCLMEYVKYIKLYLEKNPKLFDIIFWEDIINEYDDMTNKSRLIKFLFSYENIHSQLSEKFVEYIDKKYIKPVERKFGDFGMNIGNLRIVSTHRKSKNDLMESINRMEKIIRAFYYDCEDKRQCCRLFQFFGLVEFDGYTKAEIMEKVDEIVAEYEE